jgi:chromosome segregation ATPase
MIPQAEQGETARQIADRLDDAADALDLGDKESPFGLELVGEDVVNLSALIREGADTIAALTADLARLRAEHERLQECERAIIESHDAASAELARLRAEGEALRGSLEEIARVAGEMERSATQRTVLACGIAKRALAAPRAEDGTGR